MPTHTRTIVTAAALAGAVLLGACSSSESGSATTTSPSSTAAPSTTAPPTTADDAAAAKATFLADGNAICAAMNEESAAMTESYGPKGPTTAADRAELLLASADLIDRSVADLRALPQPPGDEAQLDAMYDSVGELSGVARSMAAAVTAGNEEGMTRLQTEGKAAQRAANQTFTDYGLVECGKGS